MVALLVHHNMISNKPSLDSGQVYELRNMYISNDLILNFQCIENLTEITAENYL